VAGRAGRLESDVGRSKGAEARTRAIKVVQGCGSSGGTFVSSYHFNFNQGSLEPKYST
jgi:hypothetical protein